MPENFIITANSVPDYDSWGPDNYWSCTDWIEWHKKMDVAFGREEANSKAQAAWDKQDFFEHNVSWCKYNQDFVNYFHSVGLGGDQSFLSMAYQAAHEVVEAGGNVVGSVNETTKLLKQILPLVLIMIVVFIGMYGFKKLA